MLGLPRIILPTFCLGLGLAGSAVQAEVGANWQLLAIDGRVFPAEAEFRIDADGLASGRAPCNRWSAVNKAVWPALSLSAIQATRMACDLLEEEQLFFDAISAMTMATEEPSGRLILTNVAGRSMEFVLDRDAKGIGCVTCEP